MDHHPKCMRIIYNRIANKIEVIRNQKSSTMSDHIPFDLITEIIKRLPMKSLLQWRSVSKACKSLIDSPEFIAAHTRRQAPPQRLLLCYQIPMAARQKLVSFADDDTFPQNNFAPTVPGLINLRRDVSIIGTSFGLFCLRDPFGDFKDMGILWNPSVRKAVAIRVGPLVEDSGLRRTILGFGVCPDTLDPKIVKIGLPTTLHVSWDTTDVPWKVEVYALSSRRWRRLTHSSNLPRNKAMKSTSDQVVIGRFIYWLASKNQIISFDLISECFGEVENLPECLESGAWRIFKLRESLAVIKIISDVKGCDVWVMDQKSLNFTKFLSIKGRPPNTFMWAMGFRKNGEPIVEINHKVAETSKLAVYADESINGIGISGTPLSFSVNSYMETLLLNNTGGTTCYRY